MIPTDKDGTASLIPFLERSRRLREKGGETHIHAMCVLYELNLSNVMNAVQSDHTGPSDAIDEENRRKK